MNLRNVPKWAWVVAALVAVGVWYMVRHKGSGPSANPDAPPQPGSDNLAAPALGGTPDSNSGGAVSSPDDTQLLQDALTQQQQSLDDFLSSLIGTGAAGITPILSGGGTATIGGDFTALPSYPVSPSPSPLYEFQGGQPIAYSPTAGGAFSLTQPAAAGYAALGISPTDYVLNPASSITANPAPATIPHSMPGTSVAF